jgi:hypothetical protein
MKDRMDVISVMRGFEVELATARMTRFGCLL